MTDLVPMGGDDDEIGYWTDSGGTPAGRMPLSLLYSVTPGYLQAMDISLRQNRFFTDQDRIGSEPVAVIDEVMAQREFRGIDRWQPPLAAVSWASADHWRSRSCSELGDSTATIKPRCGSRFICLSFNVPTRSCAWLPQPSP
jgi:hypothetical protein